MRKRLRELGFGVGRLPPGATCSIVDVPGVLVGHRTLNEGDGVRTGVTAVLPHDGNLYAEKVPGGCHVVNGYGKATGLTQIEELGTLESPILLTNTLAVGAVWEGGLRHLLAANPGAARDGDTVNVVVGECFDGWLSDARALPVRPEHALEALAAAGGERPDEGSVGAGTGTTCFGYKAGVGSSSRRVEGGLALGCLVVSNFGAGRDLHMLVGAEAAAAARSGGGRESRTGEVDPGGGSIMVVIATDAPLSDRQLRRLAARAGLGLGRAGSFASSGSGEYAIAFSTAQRVPHRAEGPTFELRLVRDDSRELRQLFEAAVEATQEAVLNSLCVADAMDGRDGRSVEAFPYELLPAVWGITRPAPAP